MKILLLLLFWNKADEDIFGQKGILIMKMKASPSFFYKRRPNENIPLFFIFENALKGKQVIFASEREWRFSPLVRHGSWIISILKHQWYAYKWNNVKGRVRILPVSSL